jgi:hypothetical protein
MGRQEFPVGKGRKRSSKTKQGQPAVNQTVSDKLFSPITVLLKKALLFEKSL